MEMFGKPSRELLNQGKWWGLFFDDDDNIIIKPNSKGKIRVPNSKSLS